MNPWGLAGIAANLTHTNISGTDLINWGYSPENLARLRACQAALATRSDVNLNRLAMWGHSRGAFTSIGVASDFGPALKALGFSAGGIVDDSDLSKPSYPSVTEARHITAPTIIFHGDVDPIVPPANLLRLQNLLVSKGVANSRILYPVSTNAYTDRHNIQNIPVVNADMLNQFRAWLQTNGVLP